MQKSEIPGFLSVTGLLSLVFSAITALAFLFSGVPETAQRTLPEPAPDVSETAPAISDFPETQLPVKAAEETLPRNLSGTTETVPVPVPQTAETFPDGCHPVVTADLSGGQTPENILFCGETAASPDCSLLAGRHITIPAAKEAFAGGDTESPLVLIVHTHGTESYLPEGRDYVLDVDTFNTENTEENVVAVGAVLARTLRENGIPTIHCTVMHNRESYDTAYEKECETVLSYLSAYPSIRYVLDIHRDGLINGDGEHIRPVFGTDEGDAAQIMFVVGTNENGANHPDWENNLTVAAKWQKKLLSVDPRSVRPINLRKSSFNQQYTPGSLLVEVGGNANTLAEAKRSAMLLGETLAKLIYELAEG